MNEFLSKLNAKITSSVFNEYSDNYDEERFGKKKEQTGIKEVIRKKINKNYIPKHRIGGIFNTFSELISEYNEQLNFFYSNLSNEESKSLLIDIIAFRVLKEKHVKLKTNNSYYWEQLKKIRSIADESDTIELGFFLNKFDLKKLDKNLDVQLYFTPLGILIDFFLEQYKYSSLDKTIEVNEGDIIIDAGGCWGDTALYFANKIKSKGKVYTFEFIPSNIEIFKKNISLNPQFESSVVLINKPVWSSSGKEVFFTNNGPGSVVSETNFKEAVGSKYTLSIDDLVSSHGLSSVDFIKMDIEGAELEALKGAVGTLKRFKPNLAIAIYHSMDDFVNIPKWIANLNLGYKLFLNHYTIHQEETILFATAND